MLKDFLKLQSYRELNCQPLKLDARLFAPMSRKRLYWPNIPQLRGTKNDFPLTKQPHLQDVLKPFRTALVSTLPTVTTNSNSQRSDNSRRFQILQISFELLSKYPFDFRIFKNTSSFGGRKVI